MNDLEFAHQLDSLIGLNSRAPANDGEYYAHALITAALTTARDVAIGLARSDSLHQIQTQAEKNNHNFSSIIRTRY